MKLTWGKCGIRPYEQQNCIISKTKATEILFSMLYKVAGESVGAEGLKF